MALIAVLRLHGDLIMFEETFGRDHDITATFEDFHYLTDGDGYTWYVFFWWCPGTEFEAFDGGLESDPTVTGFRVIAELPRGRFYRIETSVFPPEQPLVFPLYREHDITTIEAKRNARGLHLQARFPARESLRAFRSAASAIARNIDVVRLYTEGDSDRISRLTEKQRSAVTLAYERGYFETPSEVTLEELAEEFGVTPQTMSRHVRVGVEKLVGRTLETSPDHL